MITDFSTIISQAIDDSTQLPLTLNVTSKFDFKDEVKDTMKGMKKLIMTQMRDLLKE